MPRLVHQLRRALRSTVRSNVFHECRRCGTTVDNARNTCPTCDSREIARYDL